MSSWLSVIFLIFVTLTSIGCISFSLSKSKNNDKHLREWRDSENISLLELSINSASDSFALHGKTAVVVLRTEEIGWIDNVVINMTVTTFLRNPSGEYFMRIWRSQGKAYIKHIAQTNARIVLREKYIAPINLG